MIYGLLEIEIMNSVWNIQEQDEDADISITDVVDSLNRSGIERAYTTIKTVMDRLVTKEILVRYKNGKKFFYKSTIDRDEASKQVIDTVAAQFFNGNHTNMIRFIERTCENVLA